MLVAWSPMAGRTKPLLSRRADMSERSVISYHKIQQYNKALEKTLQRLEQDAQNHLVTQNLTAKRIKDKWEQRQAALVTKCSCDAQTPAKAVDESESQESDKASVSSRQVVTRRMVRSGSVGTLQLACSTNPGKACEGDNVDQAKCQQPLHASPVCKHTRTTSLGGDPSSLALHRLTGDRRTSVPAISGHHPSSKKRLVPMRRLASDEWPTRMRMPSITLTKDTDATFDEEREQVFDSTTVAPPRSVKCNAWESKSNSSLSPALQRLPLSSSPTLTPHSPATSSTHSMSSSSPSSPGLHRLGVACEDECPTVTGSLLPIKMREKSAIGFNERRSSSSCLSLSALKVSQTTRKEDLLEAARIMNFGPEASRSPNPAMFRKFYSHIPVGRCLSDSNRDVSFNLCVSSCLWLSYLFLIAILTKDPTAKAKWLVTQILSQNWKVMFIYCFSIHWFDITQRTNLLCM